MIIVLQFCGSFHFFFLFICVYYAFNMLFQINHDNNIIVCTQTYLSTENAMRISFFFCYLFQLYKVVLLVSFVLHNYTKNMYDMACSIAIIPISYSLYTDICALYPRFLRILLPGYDRIGEPDKPLLIYIPYFFYLIFFPRFRIKFQLNKVWSSFIIPFYFLME